VETFFHIYAASQALCLLAPGVGSWSFARNIYEASAHGSFTPTARPRLSRTVVGIKELRIPFFLALIREFSRMTLFSELRARIRDVVTKPSRHDKDLWRSPRRSLYVIPARIPVDNDGRSTPRPMTPRLVGEWFSNMLWRVLKIVHTERSHMTVSLSPDMETRLLQLTDFHLGLLLMNRGLQLHEFNHLSAQVRRDIHVAAVLAAFEDCNLYPGTFGDEINDLVEAMIGGDTASWDSESDRDTQELPIVQPITTDVDDIRPIEGGRVLDLNDAAENFPPAPISTRADNGDSRAPGHPAPIAATVESDQRASRLEDDDAFHPAVPLETLERLLEPSPVDSEPSPIFTPALPVQEGPHAGSPPRSPEGPNDNSAPEPVIVTSRSTATPSPIPGISRAASLAQVTPRPARRPTVTGSNLAPGRRDEVSRRNRQDPETQGDTYRATILSNYAAESFVYHTAVLLESVILLPLDVMISRLLATALLAPGAGTGTITNALPFLGGVWSNNPRNLPHWPSLQIWGNSLLTIGMQGMINFGLWTLGTHISLRLGSKFGWGKF
jgi:hypothetical protein